MDTEEKKNENLKKGLLYGTIGAAALVAVFYIGRASKTKKIVHYRAPFPSEIKAAYRKGYMEGIDSIKDGVRNTVVGVIETIGSFRKKKS